MGSHTTARIMKNSASALPLTLALGLCIDLAAKQFPSEKISQDALYECVRKEHNVLDVEETWQRGPASPVGTKQWREAETTVLEPLEHYAEEEWTDAEWAAWEDGEWEASCYDDWDEASAYSSYKGQRHKHAECAGPSRGHSDRTRSRAQAW